MPAQPLIVIARRTLSILGGRLDRRGAAASLARIEKNFFELIASRQPHAIVIDLSDGGAGGVEIIKKIRRRTQIPIVLVHCPDDPEANDFRQAGAAGCVTAPVDMAELNQTLDEALENAGEANPPRRFSGSRYRFGVAIFEPDAYRLSNASGASVKLTTLENDALFHFVTNARRVCARAELADLLYGKDKPASERAIDIIVTRLRKKLAIVGGRDGESVLKTEFRRGYTFVADVERESDVAAGSNVTGFSPLGERPGFWSRRQIRIGYRGRPDA